jgi:TetR/AcrR family acrAB operon transcriptional repressor
MVRRTKEEALETRNRILDAAEAVFHARGVARPSLADIAEAAGVTRGAIYWHFKNKSDVFAAMCDRVNLPVEALCSPERIASQEDPLGSIRDICAFVFRQTVNNPQWRRVFEIIFHKCEMVEDNGAIFAPAPVAPGRHGEDARASAAGDGARPVARRPRPATGRQCLPRRDRWRAGALAVLPEDFELAREAERLADAFIDTLRLSPALRVGYVPRPMAPLDAEMAALCERQPQQALASN